MWPRLRLARRRDQLVEARATEHRHLSDAFNPDLCADIDAVIVFFGTWIAAIEVLIDDQVTALTLLVHMPELGSLSPKAAASLSGLAPFNDDYVKRSGRRHSRVEQAKGAQGSLHGSARCHKDLNARTKLL
nr:hypothetical protein [uncultured Shinella sp.]